MIQFTILIGNEVNLYQRRKHDAEFKKELKLTVNADTALEAFAKVEQYAEEGDTINIQRTFGGDTFDRDFYPEYYEGTVLAGKVKTRYNKRGYGWEGNAYHNTDNTGEIIA